MGQWFNAAKSFTYAFGPKVTDKVRFVFPFLCIIGAITKNKFSLDNTRRCNGISYNT